MGTWLGTCLGTWEHVWVPNEFPTYITKVPKLPQSPIMFNIVLNIVILFQHVIPLMILAFLLFIVSRWCSTCLKTHIHNEYVRFNLIDLWRGSPCSQILSYVPMIVHCKVPYIDINLLLISTMSSLFHYEASCTNSIEY